MTFQVTETDGKTYYTTTARGVHYSLCFNTSVEKWGLSSKRLGFSGFPGFRYFDTLNDLEKAIKAFRGISQLIA